LKNTVIKEEDRKNHARRKKLNKKKKKKKGIVGNPYSTSICSNQYTVIIIVPIIKLDLVNDLKNKREG